MTAGDGGLDLFAPGPWCDPVPIHCWAIEHEGRLFVVDTGEVATARDLAFARFEVGPEQELPDALRAAGLSLSGVDRVVLTRHARRPHGRGRSTSPDRCGSTIVAAGLDAHRRSAVLAARAQAAVATWRFPAPGPRRWSVRRLERSRALSDDGRIVAVDTAEHTVGHISVICIDDDGNHVLLAGDATDTLEQLHALRADAISPDPALAVATMRMILAHARQHPTIYLPAHDPESATRLRDRTTL